MSTALPQHPTAAGPVRPRLRARARRERGRGTLAGRTVVLTGASSGIGLATARAAAAEGAALVLASRDAGALADLASELHALGAQAFVVPTDVTDPEAVASLADAAIRETGRLDAWINNAGASVWGTVEETPVEEFEQILAVDFMGVVNGCKAAIPRMRAGTGGTIVNVSSILGLRGVPLMSAYCAAKHAVVGFTDALRLELAQAGGGVRVALVLPSSVDTPLFDHARSRLDSLPGPFPPVYAPDVIAASILFAIDHPRRRLAVGAGRGLDVLQRLSPALTDRLLLGPGRVFDRQHTVFENRPGDTLDAPGDNGRERSGRQGRVLSRSAWTSMVEHHPGRAAALAGATLAGVAAVRRGAGRTRS